MTEPPIVITWPTPGVTITTDPGLVYTIGQPIDQGGYALVFEGADEFGNQVALKVLKPTGRLFSEVQGQWDRERALFLQLRHPNVVTIFDAFICENLFYIVLERAWGSLASVVGQLGSFPEPTVREVARQLLFGLHFIHLNGIIHRDLTIQNVLLFEGPQSRGPLFKISDFGISKEYLAPWGGPEPNASIANPTYVPPELLQSEFGFTSVRSDLYHLGLVLLFCLNGSLPLHGQMSPDEIHRVVADGVPRQDAERIGTSFGNFVAVLLRRHTEYRYGTALEAWRALQQLGAPKS